MTTLDLTGLSITSPLGFMAALGLLRVCVQDHGEAAELSWGATSARLHGVPKARLTELLHEHMRGRSLSPEFNLPVRTEKSQAEPFLHLREIPRADYRAAAQQWKDDKRAVGFLAGYACDAVINDKGYVARTQFDFSSARQCLALEFRRLAEMLSPDERRPAVALETRIQRALDGGPYEDQHTFGWDPATLLTHAHQAISPSASATPGQPMTVWLAVESLPFHPVVPISPTRCATTGFVGTKGYAWPQWSTALNLAEVRLLRQRDPGTLGALPDLAALWSAGITSVGKFRFFLPATRTQSERLKLRGFAQAEVLD